MDRDQIRAFKRQRETVDRLKRQERASLSAEMKLRQTRAMFSLARRLGWTRDESDPEVAAVRQRWIALKSGRHAR